MSKLARSGGTLRFDGLTLAIALFLSFEGISNSVTAQQAEAPLAVHRSQATGLATFVTARDGGAIPVAGGAAAQAQPMDFLRVYGRLFGVTDPDRQLVVARVDADRLGQTHTTYHQIHKGVSVFSGVLKVHQTADGSFRAANGNFYPIRDTLNAVPTLTKDQATARALDAVSAGQPAVEHSELVIVDPGWYGDPPIGAHLAYYIILADPSVPLREAFFVNAHKGNVLDHWNLLDASLDRVVIDDSQAGDPIVRAEGDLPANDFEVDSAYDYSGDTYDFLFRAFDRDSYDDAGGTMTAVVHLVSGSCPNAFGGGGASFFCDGTATDDIVAHEWGHSIMGFTANLIYQNQSGQLNESYSDVWGELIDLFNGNAGFAGPPGGTPWPVDANYIGPGTDTPNTLRTGCVSEAFMTVNSPGSIAGDYLAQPAAFGPALTDIGTSGDIVVADPVRACDVDLPFSNAGAMNGKIVLVDRGDCLFTEKVKNAQDQGAIAVIVANNLSAGLSPMGGSDGTIVIPSVGIGQADGGLVKTEVQIGTVNVTLRNNTNPDVRWLVGEDSAAFGGAIRDMWQPSCAGDPDTANHPLQTCNPNDNGGVHSGSGVPNHAFAMLCDGKTFNGFTVNAIGAVKAAAVWYRALNVYLTVASNFQDAYAALNQAAADLVGNSVFDPRDGSVFGTFTAADATEVDKALRAVEMNTEGLCGSQKNILDSTPPVKCANRNVLFSDDFESGVGSWTVSNSGPFGPPTPYDWEQISGGLPVGWPGTVWFVADANIGDCDIQDESAVHSLFTPTIALPEDLTAPTLAFSHFMESETFFDGGNIKIRVNAGSWQIIPKSAFLFNEYNSALRTSGNTNPMAGQEAWTGFPLETRQWGTSLVDLSSFVSGGENVQLRFDFGKDCCCGFTGWFVDDFEVYTCPEEPKFSQPPDETGEDIPSNIDWDDEDPNVVVADDFVSDGRPITAVRWWGSNLPGQDIAQMQPERSLEELRAQHLERREELAHADRATSAMPTTDDALAVRDVRPSMDADLIRSIRPDWIIGQDADAAQAQIMDTPEVRFAETTFAEMAAFDAWRDRTPASESESETSLAPPLLTSFAGTADNLTFIPPDTHGAVGPNHVAELLNNGWQVFDKTGGVVAALVSHQSFWSALGTGSGAPADFVFDPRIIYDQHSGRWLATADSNLNTAGNVSWVLVGISATSDPTGAWNLFAIDADATSPGEWADFPDLGVDADNVYVTNNMFTVSASPSFTTAKFWVISKASMIAGGPLSVKEFINGVGGSTYRACHSYDATAGGFNYLVDQGWSVGGAGRLLKIQRITGIGAAAVLTDLGFIEVATYNFSQADGPQPLCSTRIESFGTRLRNAVMRNSKIWTTHSVGNVSTTKPEVAWYEFDPTTASFGPFVMPIQQGRVADSSLYYYYPSIAVNKDECVALGFSGSDAGTFVSGYYTLRLPTDPAGSMQSVSLLKAGEDTYWKQGSGTRNRWGDYSATVVDPVDDETFWTVQEYALQQLPAGRLDVNTPPSIAGTYNAPPASFGPPLTESGTTGDVALAEPNEACSAITNPGAVSGKVALVDRGSCFFSTKVKNCQDAGAIAVIVANNVADPPFRMSAGTGDVITIPSVMVSQIDGATIRTEIGSGSTVNVRMYIVQPTVCESESGQWATWWGEFTCGAFCGDNVVNQASEECDGADATACPGQCQADCTCPTPEPTEIDGWFISFHEHLEEGATAVTVPLGLYYCDVDMVALEATVLAACDGHPVIEYVVDLADCCLVHANPDSRSGLTPAQPDAFNEEQCEQYDIDIQAVVGHEFVDDGSGGCTEVPTGRFADADFWGWHSTDSAVGASIGLGVAQSSVVTMSGADWLYGPWNPVTPGCSQPNMAFELLTTTPPAGDADANDNGIPDKCEGNCGDGLITGAEECDDGNASNNDDCLNDCTAAGCGDSFVWNEGSGTEECEATNAAACPGLCQADCTCIIAPDPLEDADDGLGGDYNRVGDFKMPTSAVAGIGQQVAIRVRLNRMYIDKNEDATQCPVREGLPDLQAFEGQVRYLGPPEVFSNNSLEDNKWVAAKLQCTPFYRDWSPSALAANLGISEVEAGTIYYYGAEVVPCSIHSVQQGDQACLDSASEECLSAPLEVRTALWGDIWPIPGGFGAVVNFGDIGNEVDAFKGIPFLIGGPDGAANKWRSMLRDNEGAPEGAISFTDIGKTVNAFKTIAYQEAGPTACP